MGVNNSSKNKEKNNKLTSSTVEKNLKEVSITKKDNETTTLNELVKVEKNKQNNQSKKKKKKKKSQNTAVKVPLNDISTSKNNIQIGENNQKNTNKSTKTIVSNTPVNKQTKEPAKNIENSSTKVTTSKSKTSISEELPESNKEITPENLTVKEESSKEELASPIIINEEKNIKDELTRQIPVVSKEEAAKYFKNNQSQNLTITDKFNYEDFEDNPNLSTKKPKKKSSNTILTILTIAISTLLILIFYLTIPKIKLTGNKNITLNYQDTYIEPGYSAWKNFQNITKEVTVSSNLKEHTVGTYQITYQTKYLFITIKKTRKITIVDKEKPVITVPTNPIKICPNATLDEINYQAYDDYDGDITSRVTLKESQNKLLLNVKDSSQNEFSLEVRINRSDEEAPVITLTNNSTVYLTSGETYNEPGYTAIDNCDGDITSKVTIEGTVGTNIGTYHLIYKVTDSAGNTGTTTRTVIRRNSTPPPNNGVIENNTIYLTFDDGPSALTTGYILDVLKEEGIKATFFVTCNGPDSLIKRIYDEGHTIALHTASHNYSYIYSSVDNYFTDLKKVSDRVKNITGVESKIIRFPGGSSNTISRTYHYGIMTELTNEVIAKGYRYYDWNVDSNDAGSASSSEEVYKNVINSLSPYRANMVLMHDIKTTTKNAIRDIIHYGKNNGYTFKKIENNTYMIHHPVNN